MSIIVNEFSDYGQRDRVIRRRLPLWEPEPPKQKVLMDLYRYWESLRPEGMIPSRQNFDVLKLKPVMGTTTVIEVDEATPENFRFRLFGTNIPLPMPLSNRTLSAVRESEPYFKMIEQDYIAARDIGTPLYHEVVALINYVTHSYARLILPFANDGRTVNQLMVSSVRQDFPDLVKLIN
ncbi:MAG TPA: PAS domain-containing protein [Stellaceae bacterium]|nr:PAS domain-containing protein [Stellaceae bacterium]